MKICPQIYILLVLIQVFQGAEITNNYSIPAKTRLSELLKKCKFSIPLNSGALKSVPGSCCQAIGRPFAPGVNGVFQAHIPGLGVLMPEQYRFLVHDSIRGMAGSFVCHQSCHWVAIGSEKELFRRLLSHLASKSSVRHKKILPCRGL